MPRFSIIVPVYNIENEITACVESVLKQDCTDVEILLVDDGSKDNSPVLCDELAKAHPEIIKVIHKENGGLSDARNVGVQNATGEYLIFLDGDDYLHEQALSMMRESLALHTADVILSEGMYGDLEGEISLDAPLDRKQVQGISGQEAICYTTGICCNWSACGKVYRREFWLRQGYSFTVGRLAEDMALIDRVVLEAKRVNMIPAFYYYRRRSGSIMHSISPKFIRDNLTNVEEWEHYFAVEDTPLPCREGILKYMAANYAHHVMAYIELMEEEEKAALYDRTRQFLWLAPYIPGREGKLIRVSLKVCGLIGTCKMLGKLKQKRLQK